MRTHTTERHGQGLRAFKLLGLLALGFLGWRFWKLKQGFSRPGIYKSPEAQAKYFAAYDAALKLWPPPYQEMDVPTRFGSTHVIATGEVGFPPLLLLHVAAANSAIWYANIADLRQSYRVYAIDTIGDAGKSMPSPSPKTRKEYVQWLLDVLGELNIEKAKVAGWSYGGWLAMNLALYAPDRVERMALLSPPAAFVPLGKIFALFMLPSLLPFSPVVKLAFWPFVIARGHRPDPSIARQILVYYKHAQLKLIPPTTFTDEELRNIHTPTLLMIGEEEALYVWKPAVQRAKALIPNIEVAVIPGAAHALAFDQPVLVDQELLKFFGQ